MIITETILVMLRCSCMAVPVVADLFLPEDVKSPRVLAMAVVFISDGEIFTSKVQ